MNSSFGNACSFFRFCKLRQLRFRKKLINLSTVLGIHSSYFSNQRSKLKLTRVHRHFRSSNFGNACSFFRFCKLRQLRFRKKLINLSTVLGIPSSYFSNQRLKLKLTIGTMNSSFGNACSFFRFCKLRQLRFWKKTINLSTVLGIHSSYFSNQRLKLKLTIGTMNSSFGNACSFFRFCKLRQLRFWKKLIYLSTVLGILSSYFSNQRSKLKLTRVHRHFRSSKFGNACTFSRFSKLGQLRFWKKTINLSTVLGIPSSHFSNQRSKLKLTRVHRHFRSSNFGNACTFFRFSKLGQLLFWKKTINLSTVLGIPSSYFSNQRLKLKLTIGTMKSSFGNACSFFRFCKLRQLRFWKKTINLSTVLGIPSSYFSNQRLKLKLTIGPWIPVSGMLAVSSVSASWGSCVSGKN